MKRILISLLLMCCVAPATLPLTGCATNPATGRRQMDLLGESQEIQIGEEAMPQFIEEYGGEIPSSDIAAYVRGLGEALVTVSERPELPWEFTVVDSAIINAFALPGGKVFISRGMLEAMTNEAQLVGVLGHEIGHVTGKHINDRMSQAIGVNLLAVGLGVAGEISEEQWLGVLGVGTQLGGTVYLLKFGRDQETEADTLGVRYMTRLGYNPLGQVQVMQILQQASGASGSRLEEFFSTHPMPQTRIDRLERLIAREYPDATDPGMYRFGEEAFQTQVKAKLADLPPARHGRTQADVQRVHELHERYAAVFESLGYGHSSADHAHEH